MGTVADLYKMALAVSQPQPPLDLPLSDALGCVVAEDVIAPASLPSLPSAKCNGYAVRASDLKPHGQETTLMVTGEARVGEVETPAHVSGSAVAVSSGAALPIGADTVVPIESTDQGEAKIRIFTKPPKGANVLGAGQDITAGAVVVKKGDRVAAPQLGAIAALGMSRVYVHPTPRVVFIPVGDGLVEPGVEPRAGTVFDANGVALAAAAAQVGADTFRVPPVPNQFVALRDTVKDQLMRADVLVTTGGLSSGDGSAVRQVFERLGDVEFMDVDAFPTSTVGVGTVESGLGSTPVFCLPGNPVAAQVGFELYVRPMLLKMTGARSVGRPTVDARASRSFRSTPGVRDFVRVRLSGDPDRGYVAEIMEPTDELWISGLAKANGLAVIGEETVNVAAGTLLSCILLD